MKSLIKSLNLTSAIAVSLLLLATCACNKDNDDGNGGGGLWNPNWLIGTWEGTTPSSITPYANTKIRIVFESYQLEQHDTLPSGENLVYAYSGTFTWDVDGNGTWSKQFTNENYPQPDFNIIIWDGANAVGGYTMNNVSLRITDAEQTDPWHSMNLDWGPFADKSGNPPTQLDFYGDIEIETGGNLEEAVYPPDAGSMIRLTKK